MSTQAESLPGILEREACQDTARPVESAVAASACGWNPQRFAAEQIRNLVRQTFLADSARTCRQVVFSPVDAHTEVASVCLQVARTLSEETGQSICIAETSRPEVGEKFGRNRGELILNHGTSKALRGSSRQISNRVWQLPSTGFWGEHHEGFSADEPRRRLDQLRAEFDFSLIQAPAAGLDGSAALLGRCSDGVILVLEAHITRRLAARQALAQLRAADARLLGTVLSRRTFPIPEQLYRRL